MVEPYYKDGLVTLYHGRFEEVLPHLGTQFDACIADPPYGQTSLAWDRWPEGWPDFVTDYTSSLWCFGTMRMLLQRGPEFRAWKFAQDVVWRKTRATSLDTSRFRRQHEVLTHWYRGPWRDIYTALPKVPSGLDGPTRSPTQLGGMRAPAGARVYSYPAEGVWVDDGTRYMTSVIEVATISSVARGHGHAINPTQKPEELLDPLIRYSCPPDGVVLDPFAGSGSVGVAARSLGVRSVLIELREEQCELTARRLELEAEVPGAQAGGRRHV